MTLASDDMGPLNRIRELEEENTRLRQDIIELRRELEDRSAQFLRPDIGRRTSDFSPNDSYRGDSNGANTAAWGEFDYKKSGRLSNGSDPDRDYLLVCPPIPSYLSNTLSTFPLQARPQTLSRNSMPPPPPLHIPSLQYSGNSQQQQQQQSRALFPQQNGSLTYPVTSPTSSSSSPSYSVRHYRSSPPPSTNSLTSTCDDLISLIICHRLSLDLRAVNRTTTLFRPLTSITLKSRLRTTITWLVPLPGSLPALWHVHPFLTCSKLPLFRRHINIRTRRTSRSLSVATHGTHIPLSAPTSNSDSVRVPSGRTEPPPLHLSFDLPRLHQVSPSIVSLLSGFPCQTTLYLVLTFPSPSVLSYFLPYSLSLPSTSSISVRDFLSRSRSTFLVTFIPRFPLASDIPKLPPIRAIFSCCSRVLISPNHQ